MSERDALIAIHREALAAVHAGSAVARALPDTLPGAEPFGKAAFSAASRAAGPTLIDGSADIVEIEVLGDWAWLRTHIEVTVSPSGGPPKTRSGYTLTILRKEPDGKWRLVRDANLLA